MMKPPVLRRAYLFIKQKRILKKWHLYRAALSVIVDKTTAFYLMILLGYVISSFFIMGDYIGDYDELFNVIEEQAAHYWLAVVGLVLLRRVMQSFRHPGFIYATAEHQLTFLPYSRLSVWLYSMLEQQFKRIALYFLLGLALILITPLSGGLIWTVLLLITFIDILMIMPQWVLFQRRIWAKLMWVVFALLLNAILVGFNTFWFSSVIVGGLVLLNVYLYPRLFQRVNWSQVVEVSDYSLWNMPLISAASGIKFKRQRKYSFLRNLTVRKRPFVYRETSIQHKMWRIYLSKQTVLIMQTIGAILVLLTMLIFIKPIFFPLALAFSVHAYTSIIAILYRSRFTADIINVLPWQLPGYKQTYFKWASSGAALISLPVIVLLAQHPTVWAPLQMLFYISVYVLLYHVKLNKENGLLAKQTTLFSGAELISFIYLVIVALSLAYPVLTLSIIGCVWLSRRQRIEPV